MPRAKLHWRDGHIDEAVIEETVTIVQLHDETGSTHWFESTDEIDDDGCDVFRELPDAADIKPEWLGLGLSQALIDTINAATIELDGESCRITCVHVVGDPPPPRDPIAARITVETTHRGQRARGCAASRSTTWTTTTTSSRTCRGRCTPWRLEI